METGITFTSEAVPMIDVIMSEAWPSLYVKRGILVPYGWICNDYSHVKTEDENAWNT